ncbi:MAG: Fic family protein [Nitrosospira sp.]|nr:Fic family protein [Nitrosospira sp.]MDN5881134.1 Fic family protein [Nitrosospira sp.]MDN5935046.1 Fic family protein [Nitrosospira sp.]
MATPSEKLAQSLEALHALQDHDIVAIRSVDLTRTHRERLLRGGFLQEVMKGWYIPSRPDEMAGESTAWYASYWAFCAAYLHERFGNVWSLAPEQSVLLHAGNWDVPRQLLVRVERNARNNVTRLLHGTSLLDVRASVPEAQDVKELEGLRLFALPAALVACSVRFYTQNPSDARAALAMMRDASDILPRLLEGGHSTIAGRLAGAFRNIGRARVADEIVATMRAAGYDVRENDPFEALAPMLLGARETSPYVNRVRLMWQAMREPVIARFPKAPGLPRDVQAYLKRVGDVYVNDAYHSLSIEGYRVNRELIERVRAGNWNPDVNEDDRNQRNALAARGYWQAFQAVLESVQKVLAGGNAGAVADEAHRTWHRELFAPSVTAGLLRPADLAGYRNDRVYIRRSMHIPSNGEAVRDLMPALFELLREEAEPAVRVVLGHFVFVYIHPYMDGNGRMGRFLMNVMLAAGGYPWTVIPVEARHAYMAALEHASVDQNIVPFADFLARLVESALKGEPVPHISGDRDAG